MVPHRPHQRDRTVKRLLPAICALVWLLMPQPTVAACELPPKPEADRHPVYILDPRESTIRFDADARLHTFTGVAGQLSGRVRLLSASRANEAAACVEVEAKSITTGIGLRDRQMRKSHLHTDRFPTILFTLSGVDQVEPKGDDRYTATLRGALTLHGVTVSLQVPAKGTLTKQRLVVEGMFPLRLSTFQIPIPALLFIPMKDEVVVSFKVVAVPE
ncbi:MAG: YceI family protein [Candidatus Methylomirabilis oxyfera]|nr:YceI family protein [Candidatus Methylomirabilis oxyfera]